MVWISYWRIYLRISHRSHICTYISALIIVTLGTIPPQNGMWKRETQGSWKSTAEVLTYIHNGLCFLILWSVRFRGSKGSEYLAIKLVRIFTQYSNTGPVRVKQKKANTAKVEESIIPLTNMVNIILSICQKFDLKQ